MKKQLKYFKYLFKMIQNIIENPKAPNVFKVNLFHNSKFWKLKFKIRPLMSLMKNFNDLNSKNIIKYFIIVQYFRL